MRSRSLLLLSAGLLAAVFACESEGLPAAPVPYVGRVEELFEAQCVRCHAGAAPAAGWRADSWLGAIACTADGSAATRGPAPPVLAALARADHAALLTSDERALLTDWVTSGGTRTGRGLHGASFADPRSPESHGRFLRARRWAPMRDANDADACGTCHAGGGPRPEGVLAGAKDAPACTSCHTEPGGALACGTCHGAPGHSAPPRDRCFFPEDAADHAHAAHTEPSAARTRGLACTTCHPTPFGGLPEGVHADGHVDVWFDHGIAGRTATFANGRCTGTCHAHGGARPEPSWTDAPMTCQDCHASPPRDHYRGACTSCHREANADGTALVRPVLHAGGNVVLGDGSGTCGACHGQGDDPWPRTGAHAVHEHPADARPVPCSTCHEAPSGRHPEGLGAAAVKLSGLALRGGRRATYDPLTKTCAGTYCHDSRGGAAAAPRWTDDGGGCQSCHASPPPLPHPQSASCDGVACHQGRVDSLRIVPAARAAHVDGLIDRAL